MINTNQYAAKALAMIEKGYTPIPLRGKIPQVEGWQKLHDLTAATIADWERAGLFQNLGLSCGTPSQNVVVIDFDGLAGYEAFCKAFPALTDTLQVKTGSGHGMHVYFKVALLPSSKKVMDIELNGQSCNIEFKSDGTQVVVPPSIHPDTQQPYTIQVQKSIKELPDIESVWAWALTLKPQAWNPPVTYSTESSLNPALLREIQARLEGKGSKRHGNWINVPCPNQAAHKHGDRTPSFGFNTADGGANCYVCGGMSIKTLCSYLSINPVDYGGIYEKTSTAPFTVHTSSNGNGHAPAPAAPMGIPVITRSSRLSAVYNRLWELEEGFIPPIRFPFPALYKFGGMASVIKPGKLIGIVGTSGGGKTSLLESMVDAWLGMNIPSLVWSPEWTGDELVERAVQRYGGATVEEQYLHQIWLDEKQRGIAENERLGVELTRGQEQSTSAALKILRSWKAEVGYLDMPYLTIGHLQSSLEATLKGLTFQPRVLILDYVQLMHALETDHDLTMYHLLMRIKAVCIAFNLIGVIATQVTKESARSQTDGKTLDGLAAQWVRDDAFQLFVTINPERTENGDYLSTAILRIAKNSGGIKGKVRVGVNWSHLLFNSQPHQNQVFEKEKSS